LSKRGLLDWKKRSRQMVFVAPGDLVERLRKLDKQTRMKFTE